MPKRPLARLTAVALALGLVAVAGQASFSASAPSGSSYVVRSGDTLWSIAKRHGVTMQQLAAANSMRLTDLLQIGRHLAFPTAGPSAGGSPAGGVAAAVQTTAASSASGSAAGASGPAALSSRTFCQVFQPTSGPRGVLPAALLAQPDRLAMRPIFVQWANRYGVLPALVEAIAWQESGWQEQVISSANAVGVGQLLPSTAQFVSGQLLGAPLRIDVAADNIQMTARFLAYLIAQTGGSRCGTIAAYYEGMGLLTQYGVIPETQAYVASVEALLPRFE